jgi:translation initiation factor IF-1
MAGEDAFRVESVVIAALPNGTYRVALDNGHQLVAFVAGKAKAAVVSFAIGDRVKLQLTPFDLSAGRILTDKKTI